MLIEIFADFSCPWCFIGRRRLARARTMRPHLPTRVVWQPFQLHPELPVHGIERRAGLKAKHGDLDRVRAMETVLEESGVKEGVKFAFDRIRRIPNTLKAHRLMRLAARSQRDDALAEQLFAAYFERGDDIGSDGTLIACAAAAGLEPAAAAEFLAGDEDRQAVASMDQVARQGGIAGVPYFVFDRRYALAGAQEPASFLPLFDALMEAEDGMLASSA